MRSQSFLMRKSLRQSVERTVTPVSKAGYTTCVRTGLTSCLQRTLFSTANLIHATTSPAGCGIADTFRLHCLQGYQVSTNRLGPAVACPLLAAVHETRERPCTAVTKKPSCGALSCFPPKGSRTLREFGHEFPCSLHHDVFSQICRSSSSALPQDVWRAPLAAVATSRFCREGASPRA